MVTLATDICKNVYSFNEKSMADGLEGIYKTISPLDGNYMTICAV